MAEHSAVQPVELATPLDPRVLEGLPAGRRVLLSGVIYTARDAAHRRMVEQLQRGEGLPFDPRGQVIYYVGPCPARPGLAIGSAGPTTSYRMDPFTPALLAEGIKGLIGKGARSTAVVDAIKQHKAVYFLALGGAGALLSRCVRKAEVVAYPDLGTEAVRRLVVDRLPLIVGVDTKGDDAYAKARQKSGRSVRPGEQRLARQGADSIESRLPTEGEGTEQ